MSTHTLPRCTPEEQGVSSEALIEFVDSLEQSGQEIHTFMLIRAGHVIAEGGWKPYTPQSLRLSNSVSKSFTSAAVGFAVSEGKLSVDDRVLSFFPERTPSEPSPGWSDMTVKHLLTMSTGQTEDPVYRFMEREDGDWVRVFMDTPVLEAPGSRFLYNSGASYMLSAIVQQATGQTVMDYLTPRLFEPLGIRDIHWEACPRGVTVGGWGLSVSTEHIAKFGQLYLNKGIWNGKKLLPEAWIEESSRSHIANGDDPNNDWSQGYGYQFWMCRHGAYRADGAFGQVAIVMPEQDAVLAFTAAVTDLAPVMDRVWETLLPALNERKEAMPANAAGHAALADKLVALALKTEGNRVSPDNRKIARHFIMEQNEACIQELTIRIDSLTYKLDIVQSGVVRRVELGQNDWAINEWNTRNRKIRFSASAAWEDENTFVMTVRQLETAYKERFEFRIDGDKLAVTHKKEFDVFPSRIFALSGEARAASKIYNEVKTEDKLLAITFDDGPNPEWTPLFLEVFRKHGAKATFYVLGTNMEQYPDLAKRIYEEGHELGNHSYSHPHLPELGREEQFEELLRAEKLIVEAIGTKPNTFRPPFLDVSDDLLSVAEQFGYPIIHALNTDSRDWETPGVEYILESSRAGVRKGAILLFHDGFGDRSQSLEAISILVPELIEQGYSLVTVSELLGIA
ncbi:hypothetical protein D7Z26_14320 [Cohnella endophytica]|uniref:NodB homology domain-containing protein n=1 Tax=Cohnella endophytica TaxID=2419778 RepID=A0A494XQL8_9BACL|nr:serine hydrolase [Cohnella endophytica]RKP52925.1 hypothetical protein D7Z26_14320 [Cohnella endophytica]